VNTIDPDLFARLMSLPDGDRMDLLEFLGATPVAQEQVGILIEKIEKLSLEKKNLRAFSLN